MVLMGMAFLLVLPMLAIFAHLFIKAWPALSWSFFTQNPRNYMTAGGIWALEQGFEPELVQSSLTARESGHHLKASPKAASFVLSVANALEHTP